MSYVAPVKDMLFDMSELADLEAIAALPGFEEAGLDTAQAVLEECANFNEGVVAPLNVDGDRHPSTWQDGAVTTTPGFKEAFRQFAQGGWQGLQHPAEFGGQSLPKTIGAACIEMLNSRQPELRALPVADRRRDRGAAHGRFARRSKALYLRRLISRRMDRHHEPDGAAGRLRPRAGAHPGRAAARRHLPALRHQDLHHLRRTRHGREHRPSRAGAHCRRTRGREGHQPVHRAEVSCRTRTARSATATTCSA